MESQLSGIFQLKLLTKNILPGTPDAHSMQMRFKRMIQNTLEKYFKISVKELISN